MKLKRYQQAAIDTLAAFLREARVRGAGPAYEAITKAPEQAARLRGYAGAYKPVKGLERTPYVCLRLPTGGGKTLLAAEAIGVARDNWLERDYPLALWLVPSDAIRRQTVEALKDRRHPYRRVLDDTFDGRVRVFDIANFTQATKQDLRANLCVFVGTIQTLKISNTNGRKVYAHNEMMEPHFSAVPPHADLERNEDGPFKGDIRFSFANLLHLHNPLVIVDEAHNAVTGLAHEMQRRINPSLIIEFTATPKGRSNILHSVTAQELKDEQMIKMPVVLEEHEDWRSAVNGAILKRAELAGEAAKERDYIRPIVLFQAQNKDQEVTVEALRDHLTDVQSIPAEQIAVVTGKQRELDGIDLKDPACPVNYVITVQALKEGWDCSFAYVFCSVANIGAAGAAEQLLGRVLRMPYAKRRSAPMLNKSYACLNSPRFQDAVRGLVDRLVDMGFDESEAAENIEHAQPELMDGFFGRQRRPAPRMHVSVNAAPEEVKGIERAAPFKISVAADEDGKARITVTDFPTPTEEAAIFELMPERHHGRFREELTRFKAENRIHASPAQRGEAFTMPRLIAEIQGELVWADSDLFQEYHEWSLKDHSHQLSEQDFSIRQVADTFEIDLNGDRLEVRHADQAEQLMLDIDVDGWTEQGLVLWLDRKVRDPRIGQGDLIAWLGRLVSFLIHDRRIPLSSLMRCQFALARRVQQKLAEIQRVEQTRIYQRCLFEETAAPAVSFDDEFRFFDGMYAGVRMYMGRHVFPKHFTGARQVPAFDGRGEDGEEFRCAVALDSLPEVTHWLRNVAKHPNSFSLPLAGARFYPDFVAELTDGRRLIVEYKGQRGKDDQSEKEKLAIGRLYQNIGEGRVVFVRVENEVNGMDMREQMQKAISA